MAQSGEGKTSVSWTLATADSFKAQGNGGYYKLKKTVGKGDGAFALQDISAGTRILVDNALFIIEKSTSDLDPFDIHQALRKLSKTDQERFHMLPMPDYAKDSPREVRSFAIFALDHHSIRGGTAQGCFVHASRFNHSCSPNCAMATNDEGQKHCYVFKNVRAGEELTFAYMDPVQYMTTDERQEYLRDCLSGPCLCALCSTSAPQREVSDLRRRLMRFLLFIRNGSDLPGEVRRKIPRDYHNNYISWDTMVDKCILWPMLLFAYLAEAEGIVSGVSLRYNYIYLIKVVIGWCINNKVRRLSVETARCLRLWAGKAREAKRLTTGQDSDSGTSAEEGFADICNIVDDIDAEGYLPWSV
ncbi:SET domain-containing protein 5 [Pseudocercospora fuligena]|uniref:SET domain-containing protein 5 n=1 Tax=Pseudocercospora fuligena TaxID=685502 RepID=A0A8H6RWH7_9PEZI|nr:SET domain-containing protein 5 [Pseudocercospora fuligena]